MFGNIDSSYAFQHLSEPCGSIVLYDEAGLAKNLKILSILVYNTNSICCCKNFRY